MLLICSAYSFTGLQVSEEVERALAKLGPPRVNGRSKNYL